jgi:hypothetical protein
MSDELAPNRRGRPPKFVRPARPITVTLPEDVLTALRAIDADIARAIVRLVEPHLETAPHPPAELRSFGNRSVILVPPSSQLGARTGVELVPLSGGRALIAFDEKLSAPQLELRVADAVADAALSPSDRALFESLGALLRALRQSSTLRIRERRILVVHHTRTAAPRPARQSRTRTQTTRR